MAGIIFLKTANRDAAAGFYRDTLGMTSWLEQPNISILRHENLLVGFIESQDQLQPDTDSLVTFFFPGRKHVNELYARLARCAEAPPKENARYRIYNFYARDPDGRRFEVQTFLHDLPPW